MALLLGCDIGTTSIKAVLYDAQLGKVVRTAVRPTPVQHPRQGWSEHDPELMWAAACDCIREAAGGQAVAGLAICSMAETGVLLDEANQPLSPMIAWYDRRSEPQAAAVESQISAAGLYAVTGQRVSPSFAVTKILWTKEQYPDLYARARRWLPVGAYLLNRLSGQAAMDYTIASRTLLFDQHTLDWSPMLLDRFGIASNLLPPAHWAGTAVGTISAAASEQTGLPRSTVCVLGGHDHLCASLAAGGHHSGAVVDSTGSANALIMLLPQFLPDPRLAEGSFSSYAYVLEGLYTLKGGLKASGSAVEWLARQLSGGDPDYASLEAAAWEGIGRQAGPIWLPHLIGSGTPQGDRFSRAAVVGMQFEHQRHDLFRGLLESLAFWTRQNLEVMQSFTSLPVESLALIGGAVRLRLLSQLKADVMNRAACIPGVPEAAAAGAALLAGLGCGVFDHPAQAVDSVRYESETIEPDPKRAEWYDALYHQVYLPLYKTLRPVDDALNKMTDAS